MECRLTINHFQKQNRVGTADWCMFMLNADILRDKDSLFVHCFRSYLSFCSAIKKIAKFQKSHLKTARHRLTSLCAVNRKAFYIPGVQILVKSTKKSSSTWPDCKTLISCSISFLNKTFCKTSKRFFPSTKHEKWRWTESQRKKQKANATKRQIPTNK